MLLKSYLHFIRVRIELSQESAPRPDFHPSHPAQLVYPQEHLQKEEGREEGLADEPKRNAERRIPGYLDPIFVAIHLQSRSGNRCNDSPTRGHGRRSSSLSENNENDDEKRLRVTSTAARVAGILGSSRSPNL